MVRMSDILKKKMQTPPPSGKTKPKEKGEPVKEKPTTTPASRETPSTQFAKIVTRQESQERKPQDMQIAKAIKELEQDIERAKLLYSKGIQLVKELLRRILRKEPIELQLIKDLVGEFVNRLVLGDKALFTLFYNDYPPKDYLYNHMINVMIMSVEIGLGLGYNKSHLEELGLAAFLHDMGMITVKDIVLQPRPLTEEEYNQIKKHPDYGVAIISQLKDLPQAIVRAIQEQHERIDGRGYPKGIKDGEITEYALIIGTVDVYEALTHTRVYRKKYPPHEAIKDILASSNSLFDTRIIKILIGRIGIYPIGSCVELNTDEIGKVIAVSDEFPLRPVVNLLFSSARKRLPNPRVVDLAKQFNLFVKKPLSDEEVLHLIKKEK